MEAKESKLSTFRNRGAVDILLKRIQSVAESRAQQLRHDDLWTAQMNEKQILLEDFTKAVEKRPVKEELPLLPQIVDLVNQMQAEMEHASR